MNQDKNYTMTEIGLLGALSRVMLKDSLKLTGAEISANTLPAGQATPFVHFHKRNEEIYLFTGGKGSFWLDGDVLDVKEGSMVRVAPAGKRCIKADDNAALSFFCVQVDAGSLVQATRDDGIIAKEKAAW